MRLDVIGLDAWGHYPRATTLTLPRRDRDLHIVCGPNEAGKSTLLAGLDALLFGFPKGHPYGHQYGDPAVALWGEATLRDGRTMRWTRRGGKKGGFTGTLAGDPMGEDAYSAALGRVDRVRWRGLFGFSDDQLREAAAALESVPLSQVVAGEVDPDKVKDALRAQADELYQSSRNARKARANAGRVRLEDLRRAADQAAVLPTAWRELVSAEEQARAAMEGAVAAADAAREALGAARLRRRAFDDLDRARAVREELARLGAPTGLDAGSERQHRALLKHRDDLAREAVSRASELRREEAERSAIAVREDVLAAAEAVEEVLSRRGRWQAATEEARTAGARLGEEAAAVAAELADLFPGEADPGRALGLTRTDADARARVESVGRELARSQEERARGDLEIAGARRDVRALEERIAALPPVIDTTALEAVLGEEPAELARRRESAAEERRLADAGRAAAAARASLTSVWAPGVPLASLPLDAEVAVAEGERARRIAAVDVARSTLDRAKEARHERERRLAGLDAAGEVRSREELVALRGQRDAGWAEIRRAWLGGEPRSALDASRMSLAFEHLLGEADRYADALFADARAVGERAALRAEVASEREREATAEAAFAAAEAALAAGEAGWAARCREWGLAPAAPEVVRAFLRGHDAWATQERDRRAADERVQALAGESTRFGAAVMAAAGAAGLRGGADCPEGWPAVDGSADPRRLDTLLRRARGWVDEARRAKDARRTAEADRITRTADLTMATDRLRAATDAREALDRRWVALRAELGLPDDLPAEAAPGRLGRLAELKRRVAAADRARGEQAARLAQIGDWEEAAYRLLPPLTGLPRTAAGDHLADEARRLLTQATRDRDRARELDRRLPGLLAARDAALARVAEADAALASARTAAGAADDDTFLRLAADAARASALLQELSRLEYALGVHRGGAPAEVFDGEVLRAGAEGLDAQVHEAERRVADAAGRAIELTRTHEQARAARDAVDGGGRAAALRQRVEEERQELRSNVEDWLAHRLALRLLDEAQRRFQQEREPVVLARTGALLAALTRGRYVEVRPDKAIHRLRAVRSDGDELDPAELSEGTRQQLYLAARLAWAERHCEEEEPLPLVLDDALSAFDDARARAALEVLSEISRRTQVLVLTHHAHVAGLAREVVPDLGVIPLGGS